MDKVFETKDDFFSAVEQLYFLKKTDLTNPVLEQNYNKYLSFLCENSYKTKTKKYKKYELKITKKGLLNDVMQIKNCHYVQLKNKILPVRIENGLIMDSNGVILDSNMEKYYFILDSYENLYLQKPFIGEQKCISHSSLLHDSWPILAGNMIIKKGQICYLDEESGHFKPRNRIFLLEQIFGRDVISQTCTIKDYDLQDIPKVDRVEIDSVKDLFDLYKYIFYTNTELTEFCNIEMKGK